VNPKEIKNRLQSISDRQDRIEETVDLTLTAVESQQIALRAVAATVHQIAESNNQLQRQINILNSKLGEPNG
jgi:methyl-accepting chemotaxis protein